MKRLLPHLFVLLVFSLIPAFGLAQAQPTTKPVAANAVAYPRVEIVPFTPIAQPGQSDWIGRGIQESLQTEVSRTGATLLIAARSAGPSDDPVAVAKQNNADLVVIGSYQIVGDDVRVNGHLINVASNATVGSFSATGPQKSLFQIEDALGEQLRRLLPVNPQIARSMQQAAALQPSVAPIPPATVYQEAALQPVSAPAIYDQTTPYDYGYAYPGYYDGYPLGLYGGIGIYGGYGRGHYGYNNSHSPAIRGGIGIAGVHSGFAGGFHGSGGGGFHGGGGHR